MLCLRLICCTHFERAFIILGPSTSTSSSLPPPANLFPYSTPCSAWLMALAQQMKQQQWSWKPLTYFRQQM